MQDTTPQVLDAIYAKLRHFEWSRGRLVHTTCTLATCFTEVCYQFALGSILGLARAAKREGEISGYGRSSISGYGESSKVNQSLWYTILTVTRKDVDEVTKDASISGNLPMLHMMHHTFHYSQKQCRDAIMRANIGGHLPALQWLMSLYKENDNIFSGATLLQWDCLHGHLAVAQWVASHFQLTSADVRRGNNQALAWACQSGNRKLVTWLVDTFSLTPADVRSNNNAAFRLACAGNHLELAQWLVSRFKLTAADVFADNGDAVKGARRRNATRVVAWLTGTKFD